MKPKFIIFTSFSGLTASGINKILGQSIKDELFPMILNENTMSKVADSQAYDEYPFLILKDEVDLSNTKVNLSFVKKFIQSADNELFVVYHSTGTNWQAEHHEPIVSFCKESDKEIHWVLAHHGENTIYGDLKRYIEAGTNKEKEAILLKMQKSIFSKQDEDIIEKYYTAIRRKDISESEIQRIKEEIKKANLLLR